MTDLIVIILYYILCGVSCSRVYFYCLQYRTKVTIRITKQESIVISLLFLSDTQKSQSSGSDGTQFSLSKMFSRSMRSNR